MRIYDTMVNHMKNPLGFYMTKTVFSWKVDCAQGKKQKAARICIAEDMGMTKLLVDTGFLADADSLGHEVALDLKPYTRYYWTVTVQTDAEPEMAVSEVQWFETAKLSEEWRGKWITCDNTQKRHPYFEKTIHPRSAIKQARLYVCGLGLYEAFYTPDKTGDMEKIGNEFLTPYSNDYNSWVQYQTYDVTEQARHAGTLSILLGNGWYKSRFGFTAREDIGYYGNEWKLIAEVRLWYEDGTCEVIGTDDTWKVRRSHLTFSNLYDGEQRDDTLEPLPVEASVYCEKPAGTLMERLSLPVTVHETFCPVELLHTPAGELVLDLGQEFAGIFDLQVNVPKGTKVHIQTGEILQNGNFYNENLRSAKSEYIYISDGVKKTIRPHFTYYGYRYVKIQGIPELKKEDFTGLALYSNITQKGSIVTGNALVNQFLSNVRWGLKSNFLDVPTDCPQRDERMGWTGDAQVFSSTALYLEDTYAFYRKYLYDMAREQEAFGGMVPDVIPSVGVDSTACVWGDAACIIPWNMYQFYGDKSILEDQFESMKSWVDYVTQVDGDNHGWRYVFHYGDWLALDNPNGNIEQVLGGTDEEFIANIYYAASAGLVADAAAVLGRREDEEKYRKLSDEQFDIVRQEYYSSTGRCCVKTQTALLLTLKYHLSDNVELTKKMLRKLFEDNNDKLKTGFVGTPLLCNVLSENGFSGLAYKLLLNKEYPGWLHELELGATTVWERWNSVLDDGRISGTGMNSLNHYSYGAVTDWIFRHGAGICCGEEAPGFRVIELSPEFNWEMGSLSAEYDSSSGKITSMWKLDTPEAVTCTFTIPFGSAARITLPLAPEDLFKDRSNPLFSNVKDGVCCVGAGTYTVSYHLTESLDNKLSVNSTVRELLNDREMREKLSAVLTLSSIPMQCMGYSLKEIKEDIFSGYFTDEMYQKVLEILG